MPELWMELSIGEVERRALKWLRTSEKEQIKACLRAHGPEELVHLLLRFGLRCRMKGTHFDWSVEGLRATGGHAGEGFEKAVKNIINSSTAERAQLLVTQQTQSSAAQEERSRALAAGAQAARNEATLARNQEELEKHGRLADERAQSEERARLYWADRARGY